MWWQTSAELGALIMLGAKSSKDMHSFTAANFSAYRSYTGQGAHSLVVDPMLAGLRSRAAPSNATDMRPVDASPVIGAGQPTIWRWDFGGAPVPPGARPSIGAYEQQG